MKSIVQQAFVKIHEEQKLDLKVNKTKYLTDLVVNIPSMVAKSATRDNIQHGFNANGLVDEQYKRHPAFNKILTRCRRNSKTEDCNRRIEPFSYLFDRCLEHGYVPNLQFQSLGFHQDINIQGNCVQRYSIITQESRQRATFLTDEYQVE